MGAMVSQITSISIVYSTVWSGADQGKYQISALLAFVKGIHRWPVNSPHKASNAENVSIWWRHHDHARFRSGHGVSQSSSQVMCKCQSSCVSDVWGFDVWGSRDDEAIFFDDWVKRVYQGLLTFQF